jgi:hypothetical protein
MKRFVIDLLACGYYDKAKENKMSDAYGAHGTGKRNAFSVL